MNTILTITGPTASGKSTLRRMLVDAAGSNMDLAVSYTTRPKRPGETDGGEYRFLTREGFLAMAERGQMLETNEFDGHLYGVGSEPIQEAWREGRIAVAVLDPNGVESLRKWADSVDKPVGIVSLWLDENAHMRYERVLDRFIARIENLELGGPLFALAKEAFARRLAAMQDEVEWEQHAATYSLWMQGEFLRGQPAVAMDYITSRIPELARADAERREFRRRVTYRA